MQIYMVMAFLFILGIGIFIFQNTAMVALHFLTWVSPEISLALVILAAACGGALITFLLDSVRYFKIAKKIKEQGTLNKKLQNEIESLKKLNWKLEEKAQNAATGEVGKEE
ncbi:MAG: LapA family protein [Syntrophomonas sp.]